MFKVPEKFRVTQGRNGSTVADGNNGAFIVKLRHNQTAYVIASDGMGWEHVSVSRKDRFANAILIKLDEGLRPFLYTQEQGDLIDGQTFNTVRFPELGTFDWALTMARMMLTIHDEGFESESITLHDLEVDRFNFTLLAGGTVNFGLRVKVGEIADEEVMLKLLRANHKQYLVSLKQAEGGLVIGKRTTTYYALIGGKRINLGHDRQAADAKLRELVNGPVAGTIAEMCQQFIAYHRAAIDAGRGELAESTVDEYENSLLKHVLPVFGTMAPKDFQPTHSAQYLFGQREKKRGVRANREMAALGSAFNFGMSKGMVASNPCHGVKRNKETPRSRRPETREVNALTQVAKAKGESAYMIILIGLMVAITGRRRAEVMRLTSFALRDDGIHVVDSKTRPGATPRVYLVSWSPLLRQLVQEALAMGRSKASGYIFATMDGTPYTDAGFKTMWNRIMHDYKDQGGVWFTTHDLRAYYVTEKGELGENPETHKNPATTKRVYDRARVVKVKPLG